jgi:RND family efflux transporter MFP subunit
VKIRTKVAAGIVLAALVPACSLWAQEKIEAITKPSGDVTLGFNRPGKIAQVLVKEGDDVKKSQELIRLDDKAEVVQLEQLKAQADDDTRVKAAVAQLAQKRVDLKQTEEALKAGAATPLEVDHAKLDVTIAELSLDLAKFERSQDGLKYREAAVQVERMHLSSPIDGKVEKLLLHEGEAADAQTNQAKIVQVVCVDPLWIEAPVPLPIARLLKKGVSTAMVEFPSDQGPALQVPGKITHIAAVADSASGTLTVRLEAPNATSRPAGEHVYVTFPPPATAKAPAAGK